MASTNAMVAPYADTGDLPMKGYLKALGLLITAILCLFLLVDWLGVPLLTDPSPWMDRGGWLAAALGIGLLIADVLLPVPSSLVMIAHGTLFGVWVGALLSLAGGLGAAATGFALGRRGGPLLARLVSPEQQRRAERLIRRWGPLAVLISRPVPVLAESVAILAGASQSMGWAALLLSATGWLLPLVIIYAAIGAVAAH